MTAAARRTEEAEVESLYEDLLSDDDLEIGDHEIGNQQRSTEDLLGELGRIREECGDFLRRYQQACGVGATPQRQRSMRVAPAPQASRQLDSVERRRAILHLLIEELIT